MIKNHYTYAQRIYDEMVEKNIEDDKDSLNFIKKGRGVILFHEFKRNLIDSFPLEALKTQIVKTHGFI